MSKYNGYLRKCCMLIVKKLLTCKSTEVAFSVQFLKLHINNFLTEDFTNILLTPKFLESKLRKT